MTVWALCKDWIECPQGGEPGAQPAHRGPGEGGDGGAEGRGHVSLDGVSDQALWFPVLISPPP